MLPQSASDFYRAQQRLAVVTVASGRKAWRGMGEDFDASWRNVGPRLVVLTSAAQLAAARNGARYVPKVLTETSQDVDADGQVNPRTFAGVAADGRNLEGLLIGSVVEAKRGMADGWGAAQSLARGGRWLDGALHTIVADAGRQASGVAIAARPGMGWVRMANPPCCSRCAILAGKWFRWNQGFQRHKSCDCTHIPALEDHAGEFRTDPQRLLERGQITDLRDAERKAIADGADLNQVVNARRGTSGLRGMTTTEGTTRRGLAGQRLGRGKQRMTPEAIYRTASSREEAIALLKANAYLI